MHNKWGKDLSKKIRAEKSVVFTDLDDGSGVLLHLGNKFYYSLNATGSFIWRLLEETEELTEEGLLTAVMDNFEVDKKDAEKDVQEFMGELSKEGLIIIEN